MCFINGHFHGTALMLDKWSVWLYPSVFPSIFTGFEEVLSVCSVKTASISDLVERLICGHHIYGDTYLTHMLRIKNDKNKIRVHIPIKACFWSYITSFAFLGDGLVWGISCIKIVKSFPIQHDTYAKRRKNHQILFRHLK